MPDTAIPAACAFADHDHAACSAAGLAQAEALCAAQGARLTPVRRRTLEILLEAHRALGAYEVLERLRSDGFGGQPPVAYRALEFLEAMGLVHRIRRLNAFAACMRPGEAHQALFLICRRCEALAEAPGGRVRAAVEAAAAETGFAVERASLEATGLCPACRAEAP
ncbi:MAG: transcriptional repressor [Rhodobacteraceae bacterium]|jgi:Fur family zinc uptake transcriptional regulator|nr:transcriptional repressor [Paracoccaceae bacterium]